MIPISSTTVQEFEHIAILWDPVEQALCAGP